MVKGGSVVGMSSVGLWDEEKILTRTEVFRGSVGKRMIVGGASVCESLSSEPEEFMLPPVIPKLWRIQGKKGLGNNFLAAVCRMDVVGAPGN